jgi:hypothetical protein
LALIFYGSLISLEKACDGAWKKNSCITSFKSCLLIHAPSQYIRGIHLIKKFIKKLITYKGKIPLEGSIKCPKIIQFIPA